MILLITVALSLVVGLLRFRQLGGLSHLSLRWGGLALVGFAVQSYFIYRTPPHGSGAGWAWEDVLLISSHILVLAVLWANRRLTGIRWISCGLLLNLLVMVANGGWMPVTPEALVRTHQTGLASSLSSGIRVRSSKSIVLARQETKLWLLSDIIVLILPLLLPSVFSVGDVLVALGVFLLLQSVMRMPACQSIWQNRERSRR